jgi:hypothetical protein
MDDPKDMADKLKEALDMPDIPAERQRRRNYMLQHHTWDIVYEEMKNEYWLPAIGRKVH